MSIQIVELFTVATYMHRGITLQVGDRLRTKLDSREIVGFLNNENIDTLVYWKSTRPKRTDVGICIPDVWVEWLTGYRTGKLCDG